MAGERTDRPRRLPIQPGWHGLLIRPHELLEFIELPAFTRRWEQMGLDDEDDLATLQMAIMRGPCAGRTIQGTHGIRKLRFAPPHWNVGKRGATRVVYVYFDAFGVVILCLVYGKNENEIDNISDAVKKHLNTLVDRIEDELRRRREDRRTSK